MATRTQSDSEESSQIASEGTTLSAATPAGRRGFFTRLVAGSAAVVTGLASPRFLQAATSGGSGRASLARQGEDWMQSLTGKHRTAFDVAAHRNGKPLGSAKNYLDAWRDAFKVPEREINLVFGIHGDGIPMVLTDALWSRFKIGEQYEVADAATKAPATRNVFSEAHVVTDGPVTKEQTVEALQRRGVRFLICMNTIAGATRKLSSAGFGEPGEVRAALLGGLLPGVATVPSMVVTLTQLQERGLAYVKLA